MNMDLAFARDRDTGELHARFTFDGRRYHKKVTLYDLDMMALQFDAQGLEDAARLCRDFAQKAGSAPLGVKIDFPEFQVLSHYQGGETETVEKWLEEE